MAITQSEQVAQSTLRIIVGDSTGSGFYFLKSRYVVTNAHVVEPLGIGGSVYCQDYWNSTSEAVIVAISPSDKQDYAVLQLKSEPHTGAISLNPNKDSYLQRGLELILSGHPFGLEQAIVARCWIAGPVAPVGYYISGSINKGNSGGPIVKAETGEVVGLATARHIPFDPQLTALLSNMDLSLQRSRQMAVNTRAIVSGLDIGAFSGSVYNTLTTVKQVLEYNANAGFGIMYSIDPVTAAVNSLPD